MKSKSAATKKAKRSSEPEWHISGESYQMKQTIELQKPNVTVAMLDLTETDTPCICVNQGDGGDTIFLGPAQARALAKILPAWADQLERYLNDAADVN